jgi:hypothetical protein
VATCVPCGGFHRAGRMSPVRVALEARESHGWRRPSYTPLGGAPTHACGGPLVACTGGLGERELSFFVRIN